MYAHPHTQASVSFSPGYGFAVCLNPQRNSLILYIHMLQQIKKNGLAVFAVCRMTMRKKSEGKA